MLPDGSPLPADMARRLAGYASTWTRILTDPATGTPLDAKATSDTIPNSLVPFDHSSPASGGLTRFGSLPHLCATHHQAKTDRQFSVRMAEPGRLEYVFKHGITTEVMSPDNPINIEHAKLFLEYFATPPPSPAAPPSGTAPPPSPAALPPDAVPSARSGSLRRRDSSWREKVATEAVADGRRIAADCAVTSRTIDDWSCRRQSDPRLDRIRRPLLWPIRTELEAVVLGFG